MFNELRKKLYFDKLEVMYQIGLRDGLIVPIEEEIYEQMNSTIIATLPVGFRIKHGNKMFALGTCYERSLYMFLALGDDAVLVRGNNKDLALNYGRGHEGHGWVEVGDYVYDPSVGYRYDKEYYYKLFKCSKVFKTPKQKYVLEHSDFIKKYVTTDLNEFRPGGKRRLELGIIIFQIQESARLTNDEALLKDLNEFLESVEYDPVQIRNQRNAEIEEMMKNDMDSFVFC